MQRKQQYQDSAYVLHCRPYRNTSLIADVLSRAHGRLSLVAKGARRGQNALATILQPFAALHLQWGGTGELMTLYKAEQAPGESTPAGLDVFSGFYVNELLIRLLHKHDPHPELFDAYAGCLRGLCATPEQDIALRYFELDLLEGLGYAMNLHVDAVSGAALEPAQRYHYIVEQGPTLATATADYLTIGGATLTALAERKLGSAVQRNEAKLLMRTVLDHYLGHRPLKSRDLLLSKKLLLASEPS